MAEYIDSAYNNKSEFIRDWLDKNLLPDAKSFRVQSGYFTYAAIEPFVEILKEVVKNGKSVRFVLGSNGGSLIAKDAEGVLEIVKVSPSCSFTVVAFQNAEFHPKCYYIKRSDDSEIALVGSGNLTQFGISLNVEAAILLDTYAGDNLALVQEIKDAIDKWASLGESDGAYQIKTFQDIEDLRQSKIIDLGNVEVIIPRAKVLHQKKPKKSLKKSLKGHWPISKTPGLKPPSPKAVATVLIAEIPNAGGRWKQANFDQGSFEKFFGLTIGDKTKHISLQSVDEKGTLGSVETRQGVSVKSHNYRIELAAAAGLDYPSTSAPIGVFVRVAPNYFRYRLLMPTDPYYKIISAFLSSHWSGPVGRKRRTLTDTKELRKAWHASPLWVQASGFF